MAAARPPVEETTMRTAKVLALGLMLTLASAGCARNSDNDGTGVATAQSGPVTASAGPSPTASRDPDAPLKFAKCMRENGITWFPDPDASGRTMIRTPKGFDPKKFEAAQEACKQYSPRMDDDNRRADPEMLENARQMAKCMRENGVPNFPDPKPDGGLEIDGNKLGMGPGDPTFDKAEQKCAKFLPGPGGGSQVDAGGAGKASA
jgi:hypothetical protein